MTHGTSEHSPVDLLLQMGAYPSPGGRWFGIYLALVSDIKDPDGSGRVKVTLPWSPDNGSDRYEM